LECLSLWYKSKSSQYPSRYFLSRLIAYSHNNHCVWEQREWRRDFVGLGAFIDGFFFPRWCVSSFCWVCDNNLYTHGSSRQLYMPESTLGNRLRAIETTEKLGTRTHGVSFLLLISNMLLVFFMYPNHRQPWRQWREVSPISSETYRLKTAALLRRDDCG